MISYQLYSSREYGPLRNTLRMVADAGYRAVEGYGAMLADADGPALRALLDEHGLRMTTAHVGLDMLEADAGRVVDLAETLATEAVFAPHIAPGDRPGDADGWRALGRRLAEIGKPFEARGVRFGWHNHDFELAALPDGSVPLDLILESGIAWEGDLAWIGRAGADPAHWVERHGEALIAVHVKDVAPEGENAAEDGWADPGAGTMDWPRLARLASDAGLAHWVVEHDNPSDDLRFARAAMRACRAWGLGA